MSLAIQALLNKIQDRLELACTEPESAKTAALDARSAFRELKKQLEPLLQPAARVRTVSIGQFLSNPAGRDILLRAWVKDPRQTEHDLIRLGDREAASVIGAEYQAGVHRGEIQPELPGLG